MLLCIERFKAYELGVNIDEFRLAQQVTTSRFWQIYGGNLPTEERTWPSELKHMKKSA